MKFWLKIVLKNLINFSVPFRSFLFGKLLEGKKSVEGLHQFAGRIEFNVSKHVLDIVYTQAICWLALFYAPLISIVTVLKCIFIYALRIFFVIYVRSLFLCHLNDFTPLIWRNRWIFKHLPGVDFLKVGSWVFCNRPIFWEAFCGGKVWCQIKA